MIRPISNISHQGVKSLRPRKVSRQVINTVHSAPKGITKTPLRCEVENDSEAFNKGIIIGCIIATMIYGNVLGRATVRATI